MRDCRVRQRRKCRAVPAQIIGNRADASCGRRFLKAGPEAVEISSAFEVRLRAYARHPDYRSELEGAVVGAAVRWSRCRSTAGCSARRSGRSVRRAEFTLLGGMMVDRTDIGHLLASTKSSKS